MILLKKKIFNAGRLKPGNNIVGVGVFPSFQRILKKKKKILLFFY